MIVQTNWMTGKTIIAICYLLMLFGLGKSLNSVYQGEADYHEARILEFWLFREFQRVSEIESANL